MCRSHEFADLSCGQAALKSALMCVDPILWPISPQVLLIWLILSICGVASCKILLFLGILSLALHRLAFPFSSSFAASRQFCCTRVCILCSGPSAAKGLRAQLCASQIRNESEKYTLFHSCVGSSSSLHAFHLRIGPTLFWFCLAHEVDTPGVI